LFQVRVLVGELYTNPEAKASYSIPSDVKKCGTDLRQPGRLPEGVCVVSLRTPTSRLHNPTGQAVVTLNGHDHYLGKHGTPESQAEYDRLIAEWLVNGRHMRLTRSGTPAGSSVNELILGACPHFGPTVSILVQRRRGRELGFQGVQSSLQVREVRISGFASWGCWPGKSQ
jgi:hypothetical protein